MKFSFFILLSFRIHNLYHSPLHIQREHASSRAQQSMCNTIHIISYDDDDEKEAQQRKQRKVCNFSFVSSFVSRQQVGKSWKTLWSCYIYRKIWYSIFLLDTTQKYKGRAKRAQEFWFFLLFPASTLPFLWKTLNLPKMMLMKGNKNHRIFVCSVCHIYPRFRQNLSTMATTAKTILLFNDSTLLFFNPKNKRK